MDYIISRGLNRAKFIASETKGNHVKFELQSLAKSASALLVDLTVTTPVGLVGACEFIRGSDFIHLYYIRLL